MDGFEQLVRTAVPVVDAAGGTGRPRRAAHAAAPGQALRSAVPDDALVARVPGDVRASAPPSTHAWMGPDGLVIPLLRGSAER